MNYLSRAKLISHKFVLVCAVVIQIITLHIYSLQPIIYAQEATEEITNIVESPPVVEPIPEPVEIVQPVVQGPQEPPGPENRSYTYNSETGLWENQYYTWNPITKKTSPKSEQNYSFNPETGRWDTTEWIYAPEIGAYKPQIVSTVVAPTNDQTTKSSDEKVKDLQPTFDTSSAKLSTPNINTTSNPYLNPGPGSLSVTTYDNTNGSFYDNFFNAKISVTVNSSAKSGNASVLQNTIGGSALTGDASAVANIMNLVQSAWGVGGLMPYLYTENIQGDYFGDIFLDPSLLKVTNNSSSNELIVNSVQDVAIVNDIELKAQSGDALVQKNTEAGDAVSGDATAILNLMNVINSSLTTGQSFIGMLNIFGNLEGDVLFPDNMLDTLLSSNIPTTQIQIPNNVESNLVINNSSNQTILNDIVATASSGNALVDTNTNAGDAISGDADTNVTVFNLTGSQIIAEQAMLVFVQVMGEWVGFITNAPTGSNVALLGSGVESNISNINAEINNSTKSLIENNVLLNAETGDASVLQNTTAGDAKSGNANTIANITNISNSSLSLSNWFGLLFINVFGNWSGSFGTNTPFGSILSAISGPKPQQATTTDAIIAPQLLGAEPSNKNVRVFAINTGANSSGGTSVTSATPVMEEDVPPPTVLSDTKEKDKFAVIGNSSNDNPLSGLFSLFWVSLASIILAAIIYRRVQLSS